jgi:methyl-accepting chemotaxis protein
LRYIVGRLQRAADSIETVVGEVLRGTQMLSSGVLDEAKSVEETSSSIAEINASMHSVGESLQTLLNLSQSTSTSVMRMATSINQVSENADELAQFVEETVIAIEDMANTVRKVADSTEALAESAEKTVGAMEAIDNSTRANNVINTAEGSLNEISSLLLDVRGLINHAANTGANSTDEAKADQLQIDSGRGGGDHVPQFTAKVNSADTHAYLATSRCVVVSIQKGRRFAPSAAASRLGQ